MARLSRKSASPTHPTALLLLAVLLLALAVRLILLLGPHHQIDADEAIVGLMALNIPRELPAFYWEQHYLGAIEAYSAAALFALVGPSDWALKLVPAFYSVAFVGLVFETGRRAFGTGPAVFSAIVLAIPPSFLGVWSVKARGGYAELLALGQLSILLAQLLVCSRRHDLLLAGAAGLVGGLALWTHPLALVYLGAATVYLVLALRDQGQLGSLRAYAGIAVAGALVGLMPAIIYNVSEGFPTLRYVVGGGTAPAGILVNLWGLLRYGAPVLVGLAEGTASKALLDADWPARPGSNPAVTAAVLVLVAVILWSYRHSLGLSRVGWSERAAAPFLLVVLLVPPFVAVSRFADLWAEPRYAIPVYSAAPLFGAWVWRLGSRSRSLAAIVFGAALITNMLSLATTRPELSLPTSAGASTRENRAELAEYLLDHGLTRVYTEYWIGYPLAFESGEQIVPAIRSGGFDRRYPYAHQVWTERNPAFVFPRDALGDREFQSDLAAAAGSAEATDVSVYRVYTNVEPLARLRP